MTDLTKKYGTMVFSEHVMKQRLPSDTYKKLAKTIKEGKPLDIEVANVVAHAMKEWAIENGCTHYTHWFQPLSGITSEKHDAFIDPLGDGAAITSFSGKELIQGEPDASSFPSGGLRGTAEARGYTAWDPTSFAFIKDEVLCIPTAFCSYCGEALDKKTPLLRSAAALNTQALRILRLFGNTEAKCVRAYVGPEQEYFLVDKKLFDQRYDLRFTGRTLFGARSPKGQEMEDHYFGVIKPRVAAYMQDLNRELWKLGIVAKTEHNEVAPAQHELAPIFTTVNVATDNNQLTMEIMQKVALKHGMVCLLHEKPFDGVNGSGKHNNWSIGTDTGINLLSPGKTPYENAQFLLFLCAVIKAADDYQDLLRLSVATAGNDHRLGANEAPPAVMSIFVGDELSGILDAIEKNKPYQGSCDTLMKLGVDVLPKFNRDTTDRNRTSPFAFTGNKFEFRMLGSSDSIACANIMLNSAVAESLRIYADRLEQVEDFETALHEMIRKTITDHKRIIFNGNGYDDAWIEEARKRGLSNYPTTPDAMPHLLDEKNVRMLTSHGVFSEAELESRTEIMLDNYCKSVRIEADTMSFMARTRELAETCSAKKDACPTSACAYETKVVMRLSELLDEIESRTDALDAAVSALDGSSSVIAQSAMIRDDVIPAMNDLRNACDEAETVVSKKSWPFPVYGDLLFSVQ